MFLAFSRLALLIAGQTLCLHYSSYVKFALLTFIFPWEDCELQVGICLAAAACLSGCWVVVYINRAWVNVHTVTPVVLVLIRLGK